MEGEAILSAIAELIRAIPRSGLLVGTIVALVAGWIGSMMLRRKVAGGRLVRSVSTLALVGILVAIPIVATGNPAVLAMNLNLGVIAGLVALAVAAFSLWRAAGE